MNYFPLLARFNEWANSRIFDSTARLDDAAYRADRKAYFGSIHHTLNHILVVDRLWTARIRKVDSAIECLEQILHDDFAALREARRAEDFALIELVDRLDDSALAEAIPYRRIIGSGMEEESAGLMLLTLFNHQTHHRGQVHAMLTQSDIDPPPLDIIVFRDEERSAGAARQTSP